MRLVYLDIPSNELDRVLHVADAIATTAGLFLRDLLADAPGEAGNLPADGPASAPVPQRE